MQQTVSEKYWPNHKNLCQFIAALVEQRQERVDQSSLFNSSLSQHGREKVAGLVGENCLVKCMANKNPTVMLLDTGARVSIVRKSYLTKNYPELTVKQLKEILESGDSFRVQWGNNTQIPFLGWTSLNVQVGDEANSATLDVPYLVTSGEIEYPILGFNAIREIVKINDDTQMLKKIFENVFNSTNHQKIDSLVNFIATAEEEVQTCVKIKGKDTVVPAGKVLHVQCKANVWFLERKTPMMFQIIRKIC